jgi:hypothetical protein
MEKFRMAANEKSEGSDHHSCELSRDDMKSIHEMLGPGHVDSVIRQAIQMCWLASPKDKRTPDEIEATLRRIFERALRNFREDAEYFQREAP